MQVKSTRYPELRVHGAGVKFAAGVAEVDDPAALDVLRGLGHMGVVVPGDADVPAVQPAAPNEPEAGDSEGTTTAVDDSETATADEPQDKPDGEPRGNASTEMWADYARELGVEFPEDANRKTIQEAIDAAGK